jgi:hypothetical protein
MVGRARVTGTIAVGTIAVGIVALMTACSGEGGGLLAPTNLNDSTLNLTVDGATCPGLTSVTVFVDGTRLGDVRPGDSGIRKTVRVGDHAVSAAGWIPQFVTVAQNGARYTSYCHPSNTPYNPPTGLK